MKCPACDLDFSSRDVRGVGVQVCISCLGVFLDKAGLDRAVPAGPDFLASGVAAISEIDRDVFTDPLSGLRNRKFFDRQILAEASRASRGGILSLVLFDLDGFKNANDEFGHLAGDRVLAEFAKILLLEVRQCDAPARIGGDEFGVLMPLTAAPGARALASRVIERVAAHRFTAHEDEIVSIGASAGFAVYPDDTGTLVRRVDAGKIARKLFDAADRALYLAKDTGKGKVVGAGEIPIPTAPTPAPGSWSASQAGKKVPGA